MLRRPLLSIGLAGTALAQVAAPVVPGLHGRHPLDEVQAGRLLFEELRCAACHAAPWSDVRPATGPDLTAVGERASPEFLRGYIADPARVHPGTKMPDLLASQAPARRAQIAADIAALLVARALRPFARPTPQEEDLARGRDLFHSVGCVACHAPRVPTLEGGPPPVLPGAVGLEHVPAKYGLDGLASFLFQPTRVRPAGRMPDLGLTRGEARSIASYLIGPAPVSLPAPAGGDAARGRRHFQSFGCAACHTLEGALAPEPAPAVEGLDPTRGCLAAESSDTPRYSLDAGQRASLARAIGAPRDAASVGTRIGRTLTAFNCIACHTRDGYGGGPPALDPYFETSEHDLGDHGRIPPTLTLAGAKLTEDWLLAVLFDGANVRPYMHTRMPRFGEANLAHLPALLARADEVEPFEQRVPSEQEAKAWREAGRGLLGNTGLACIACHDFNGKPSPGFRGVDLINSPERLRFDWFARFLIAPRTYRPGIVMPESWPGGQAAHPGFLAGDSEDQIQAIWHFLTLGRSAGDPPGISSVRSMLEVTDRARTYRGRSGIAGFRGIAVGFPGGLSYAFDAHHGSLAGVWQGEFVSVNWSGQGAGDFNPAGRAVALPRDVSFHRLADERAPWPLRPVMTEEQPVDPHPRYARDLGYRFRGYAMDRDDVPTFSYSSGALEVEDRSQADLSGEYPTLKRVLRLSGAVGEVVHFRALTGVIQQRSSGEFEVPGMRLTVRPKVPTLLRPLEGQTSELLLVLDLARPLTVLALDYALLR